MPDLAVTRASVYDVQLSCQWRMRYEMMAFPLSAAAVRVCVRRTVKRVQNQCLSISNASASIDAVRPSVRRILIRATLHYEQD